MGDTDEAEPRQGAYRLKEKTLDEVSDGKLVPCDSCGEISLFGNAVGLRVRYSYMELCADCAMKIHDDFNEVANWRPAK